jgi:hypothetical protein
MKFFSRMTEPSLFAPSWAMKPGRSLAMQILLWWTQEYQFYLVESFMEFKGFSLSRSGWASGICFSSRSARAS